MTTEVVNYEALLARKAAELQSKISKPSGDRIKITQAKQFKFPDGTTSSGPFDAIILDFVSANSYYANEFNRDEITAPDCFALGAQPSTLVPSAASPAKQADTCASCPQNQFGSAQRGKGKACKNNRLIALVPPDFTAETPIWLMTVSPTAIKAFDQYVASIAGSFNMPPVGVVTTIGFDPKSDFPSLRFGNPQPNPRIEESVGRMEEATRRLMTEPDYAAIEAARGAATAPVSPFAAAPSQAMASPRPMGRSAARVVRS